MMFKKKKTYEQMSEHELLETENGINQGNFQQQRAIGLLDFYYQTDQSKRAFDFLERIFSASNQTLEIVEYAVQLNLIFRNFRNAFRLAEQLCYEYDRFGPALLSYADLATLNSRYTLSNILLNDYSEHNGFGDEVFARQGQNYLRLQNLELALDNYSKVSRVNQPGDLVYWLERYIHGGKPGRRKNWYGHRHNPDYKLAALVKKHLTKWDWNRHIKNARLQIKARSLEEVDIHINSFRYVPDQVQFDQPDRWQMPEEFENNGIGDCEDFALWVWVQLRRIGYICRFVVGGHLDDEINHAWVCLYQRHGVKVLECTPMDYNIPIDVKNAPEYTPFISIDHNFNFHYHR